MHAFRVGVVAGVLFLTHPVQAAGILDIPLPIGENGVESSFLRGPISQSGADSELGYIQLPLKEAAEDQVLCVTVIYEETDQGGPSLLWMGQETQKQETLSANLGEGVRGRNQRTVMVPDYLCAWPGTLVISGDLSKIHRVRLDWASGQSSLVAGDQEPAAFILADRLLNREEMKGTAPAGTPDGWVGDVFEASLQEEAQSLDGNVEFVVPLAHESGLAVFTTKVLGLPMDQGIEVWINGVRTGTIRAEVPSLNDPGYTESKGEVVFAGWRKCSFAIPAARLRAGENSILLSVAGTGAYIKDSLLQMRVSGGRIEDPEAPHVNLDSLQTSYNK